LWSREFTLSFGCLTVFWGSVLHCGASVLHQVRLVFQPIFVLHQLQKSSNQTIFTQEDPLGNQEQMADRHVRPGILQSVFCYKKKQTSART
jgi:hypothetical protein